VGGAFGRAKYRSLILAVFLLEISSLRISRSHFFVPMGRIENLNWDSPILSFSEYPVRFRRKVKVVDEKCSELVLDFH